MAGRRMGGSNCSKKVYQSNVGERRSQLISDWHSTERVQYGYQKLKQVCKEWVDKGEEKRVPYKTAKGDKMGVGEREDTRRKTTMQGKDQGKQNGRPHMEQS